MTAWADLVGAALLGVERRPPAVPAPGAGPAALLAALNWAADPEGATLTAAGSLAVLRSAAGRTGLASELPPAAPAERLPRCSDRAAALLRRALGEPGDDLVALWLERAAAAGVRVAPELLPELLVRAGRREALRPGLRAAGGARVAWLGTLEPAWRWATRDAEAAGGAGDGVPDAFGAASGAGDGSDPAAAADGAGDGPVPAAAAGGAGDGSDPSAWETGDAEERLALLRAVRAGGRPVAAVELLERTWAQDPPELRRAFVGELAVGLAADDEPFLERALDDRRKPVRDAAAALLGRLDRSAHAGRMAARLAPLVGEGGRLRRRVEVELPQEPDRAGVRDGLRAKGAAGVRQGNLATIVAAVAPGWWTTTTGLEPGALLGRLGGPGADATRAGLVRAVAGRRDPVWAHALLGALAPEEVLASPDALGLLGLLDAPGAQAAIERLSRHAQPPVMLDLVAEHVPGPWTAGLSARVVALLATTLEDGWWRNGPLVLSALAARLHPEARAAVERLADRLLEPGAAPPSARDARDLLDRFDLRLAITKEL